MKLMRGHGRLPGNGTDAKHYGKYCHFISSLRYNALWIINF